MAEVNQREQDRFRKKFKEGERQDKALQEYLQQLELLPDDELEIMYDTHPSNIHIRREYMKRQGK